MVRSDGVEEGRLGKQAQTVSSAASAKAGQSNCPIAATSAKVIPSDAKWSTCSLPLGAIL